jgi:hypothetical protein
MLKKETEIEREKKGKQLAGYCGRCLHCQSRKPDTAKDIKRAGEEMTSTSKIPLVFSY